MCKYMVKVDLDYGSFEAEAGSDYKEAIDRYKKVREDFNKVPCVIRMINKETNKDVFAPTRRNNDFVDSFNSLIDVLYDLTETRIDIGKETSNYDKTKSEWYHEIEEANFSNLNTKQKVEFLEDLKADVTKRRINKKENAKYATFQGCLNDIIDRIVEYEKKEIKSNFKYGKARKHELKDIENLYQ